MARTKAVAAANHIRWALRKDIPAMVAMGGDGLAWDAEQFLTTFRSRNCIALVVENARGEVIGFAAYELQRDALRLLNLGVRADFRRRGVATALMNWLTRKLYEHGRERFFASVPGELVAAQRLLHRFGFWAYAVEDGDTYLFELWADTSGD